MTSAEVLSFSIGKLVSIIESEAWLLAGIDDELSDLKTELRWMKSFLEDAYQRNTTPTETEQSWVAEVRDVAYKAEHIRDEFMYQMNKQQIGGQFMRLLYKTIHFPKHMWVRHKIARELQKIKTVIKGIPERRQRYLVQSEGSSSRDHRRLTQNHSEASLFFRDEDLVGIEDDRQQLLEWLRDGEPQRTVTSMVGMGGSGKTTLAANVYNHQDVKRHFDCFAWLPISQTYDIEDLLRGAIKEFYDARKQPIPRDLGSRKYKELVEMLVGYLQLKRYIIVLDDVWNGTLWSDIRVSLPDEGLGSRVILTTRHEDIAYSSFGVKSHVHRVKPMSNSTAWQLFCMKAFSRNPNRSCPQELEVIAQDLVAKCEGLPLAIVTLGGLMASKKLESEWRRVYNSLNWELNNNQMLERVKIVLLLSFNDLPHRLKCCFLYCCLFPEDYQIKRKRLVRLWMAEGFIEKVKGRTPEDVAEGYLMELISRSMLQVATTNTMGKPCKCKMHDLLRELALLVSKTEKFCTFCDWREASEEDSIGRLSMQPSDKALESWKGISQLRSLFVFSKTLQTLPSGLRLLRVLDMEDAPIVKLPDQITDLFNLRYLNMRGTQLKELPKSIGRLRNLQTLDIRHSKVEVLPTGITKLQNLRHLYIYHVNFLHLENFELLKGAALPARICQLKKLQVLATVEAERVLMKQARNMTQLTRLGIYKVKEADEEDVCIAIQEMKLLRYLTVMVVDEKENLRLHALSIAPPFLKSLTLVGKLERVPLWFHSLQNLTRLILHWSRLEEDPLKHIQKLPNLGELGLTNAYTGTQLCFNEGFHKLKSLWMLNFPQLNEIIIEKGAMSGLKEMSLWGCMGLKMVPHGIQHLINLQELRLIKVSDELIERINKEGNVDYQLVRHIPSLVYRHPDRQGILPQKGETFFNLLFL